MKSIERLPDLYKKTIRVKDDAQTFDPNIRGKVFEVKEVDWDSNEISNRKPVVRIEHKHYAGYNFSWLSLDKFTVKGEK